MNDKLTERIKTFTPPAPIRTRSRIRQAIDRVRWHICGLFGVKHTAVTDTHVALFLRQVDAEYVFTRLPGIGYQTEEDLIKWARRQS